MAKPTTTTAANKGGGSRGNKSSPPPNAPESTAASAAPPPAARSSSGFGGVGIGKPRAEPSNVEPCPEFGPGWTVETYPRKKKGGNTKHDRFYCSPDGMEFRSKIQAERYLDEERKKKGGDENGKASSAAAAAASSAHPALLDDDKPLTNIKVKVKVTSNEILSVSGNPVEDKEGESAHVGEDAPSSSADAPGPGGEAKDSAGDVDDDKTKTAAKGAGVEDGGRDIGEDEGMGSEMSGKGGKTDTSGGLDAVNEEGDAPSKEDAAKDDDIDDKEKTGSKEEVGTEKSDAEEDEGKGKDCDEDVKDTDTASSDFAEEKASPRITDDKKKGSQADKESNTGVNAAADDEDNGAANGAEGEDPMEGGEGQEPDSKEALAAAAKRDEESMEMEDGEGKEPGSNEAPAVAAAKRNGDAMEEEIEEDQEPESKKAAAASKNEMPIFDDSCSSIDDEDDESMESGDSSKMHEEEKDEEPRKRKPTRAAKSKAALFNYNDSSSEGDDYSDDPSYKGNVMEDDEDDDDESVTSPRRRGARSPARANLTSPYRGTVGSLLNARVRMVAGYFKGKVGTIIGAKCGWYTLDTGSGDKCSVRGKDLEVIRYAGGTEEEVVAYDEEAASNDDDDDGDLTGATIRIHSGKFEGLTGVINERKQYRHVQIDSPSDGPVAIDHVEVLSYDEDAVHHNGSEAVTSSGTASELMNKYMGATVRIKEVPEGEDGDDDEEGPPRPEAGVEGKVVKVIVGDWWITDNPEITNAYQAHKFDIISYPPGWKPKKKDKDQSQFLGTCIAVPPAAPGDQSDEEEDSRDGGKASKKKKKKKKTKKTGIKRENEDEQDATSDDETNSRQDYPTSTDEGDAAANHQSNEPQRNLIGASIRITRGRYRGLTGTIKERQDLRQVLINNVLSLGFDNIEVLEYAQNDVSTGGGPNENDEAFARKYQRYMGARVKVISPPQHAGVEGVVTKVTILGEWFVTDNTNMPVAFPRHKFEVLRYASDAEEEEPAAASDDDDDVSEGDCNEDDTKIPAKVKSHDKSNPGIEMKDISESRQSEKGRDAKTERKIASDNAAADLVGATVVVHKGAFKGLSGKLLSVQARGWWVIDHPDINNRVQCNRCKLVDDGSVDLKKVREWYESRGRLDRMPGVIKPAQLAAGAIEDYAEEFGASSSMDVEMDGTDHRMGSKRKADGTDFRSRGVVQKKRRLGVVTVGYQAGTFGFGGSSIFPPSHGEVLSRGPRMREGTPPEPALNPVVLQSSQAGDSARMQFQLLPASLRHLPSTTKIDIFNRRTGVVMTGSDAILLKDLPKALMDHAEYEPIIPTGSSSITSRVGRSGPNVRINRDVVPQSRVRASRVEGRRVLVIGGEYRGLSGTIDSCIPGGWYLVKNLFKNDMDAVINSKNLELVPKEVTSGSSEGRSASKFRFHIKAANLRLEAFAKERSKLETDASSGSQAVASQLIKLDAEVRKTKTLIADWKKQLDRLKQNAEQPRPINALNVV